MISFKIYNYNNVSSLICISDKNVEDISRITVLLLSGDEIVRIYFRDETEVSYDSADLTGEIRIMGYYDGDYSLSGDAIQKWLNWKPHNERTHSYSRQRDFTMGEDNV